MIYTNQPISWITWFILKIYTTDKQMTYSCDIQMIYN